MRNVIVRVDEESIRHDLPYLLIAKDLLGLRMIEFAKSTCAAVVDI